MTLSPGNTTPAFSLPTHEGKMLTNEDFKGKNVVLYFYPKDNTPGCTIEGKDFNALLSEFEKANTHIIGISKDSLKKHENFCTKYAFKFDLGSDEDGTVCEDFGVWVEKSMFGKKYMGIERATYLIDTSGNIADVWRKVKVKGHAQAVLDKAQSL